jgi:phage terminase large subunit
MKADKVDFHKLKHPESFIYKVYHVYSATYYSGHAEIAAENITEANKIVADFKAKDVKNKNDSYGWSYIDDEEPTEFSDIRGIIHNDIYYKG